MPCRRCSTPNGIFQMTGNVWEWLEDSLDAVPCEPDHTFVPWKPMRRIVGGAFNTYFANEATCHFVTGQGELDRRDNIGFRCAVSAEALRPAPRDRTSAIIELKPVRAAVAAGARATTKAGRPRPIKKRLSTMTYGYSSGYQHFNRALPCPLCGADTYPGQPCSTCLLPIKVMESIRVRPEAPRFVGVLGPSGVGKTVYLGMLLDLLARGMGGLRGVRRAHFPWSFTATSSSPWSDNGSRRKRPSSPIAGTGCIAKSTPARASVLITS